MNLKSPALHAEIIQRLKAGESIRSVAFALRVARNTVQIRKNALVLEGYVFPECQGGRVREQSSITHARRVHTIAIAYHKQAMRKL